MAGSVMSTGEKRRVLMLESSVWKLIPLVAGPMILSMLVDSIYNMTDTWFVSRLGTSVTAAVGINDSLMSFLRAIALTFGSGAMSALSRLLGARRDEEANRMAASTLYMAVGVLAVVAAVGLALLNSLVGWLGATENVRPHAVSYARFILLAAPLTAGEVVIGFLLRAEGSTRLSMFGSFSGCLVNVALDPLFIFRLHLGIGGAALATCLSKVVSLLVLVQPFYRKKTMLSISPIHFRPTRRMMGEVIKMGMPAFIRSVLMTGSFVTLNHVAGAYGDAALAAVSISKKTTGLVAASIMGFGQGFQPIAGFCWGAGRFRRVREAFFASTTIGWMAAIGLGVLLGAGAPTLSSMFTVSNDPEIVRISTLMIRAQCVTMIPHVWGVVVNGLCLAAGRPLLSTVVGLSRNFICLVPSILIASALGGLDGLAVSQAVADGASLLIVIPSALFMIREARRHERLVENAA